MKDQLISSYKDILRTFKTKHKGILSLLSLFGDVETMVWDERPKLLPLLEKEVPITLEAASRREQSEDNTYWNTSWKVRNRDPYMDKNESWDLSILSEAHYA